MNSYRQLEINNTTHDNNSSLNRFCKLLAFPEAIFDDVTNHRFSLDIIKHIFTFVDESKRIVEALYPNCYVKFFSYKQTTKYMLGLHFAIYYRYPEDILEYCNADFTDNNVGIKVCCRKQNPEIFQEILDTIEKDYHKTYETRPSRVFEVVRQLKKGKRKERLCEDSNTHRFLHVQVFDDFEFTQDIEYWCTSKKRQSLHRCNLADYKFPLRIFEEELQFLNPLKAFKNLNDEKVAEEMKNLNTT